MRIGICSYWFNRGQAVVARQLRSALDELGHETYVLARPTRRSNIRGEGFIDRTGVWDQPGVREASEYEIPAPEYLDWSREHDLELVFFDQNYGFEAIAALRRSGVRTVGRFVWEQFSSKHVGPAREALDVIYSMTACELDRYAQMGVETPRVHWGIHPELLAFARDAGASPDERAEVVFFYPAGFLTKRKPVGAVVKAFRRTDDPRLRLVIKGQVERSVRTLERAEQSDPRISVVIADLPTEEHMASFAASDVCLAPSRWEGLGLHLFEATAMGLPIITNDNPPMNEVVTDGANGLLVKGRRRGRARSGIPAYAPSVRQLTEAIERMADPDERAPLATGAREARDRFRWARTVDDLRRLIAAVA